MKIVSAVNAMLSNPSKITSVIPAAHANELFFLYDGKYKWSILHDNSDYSVFYYPANIDLTTLASFEDYQWSEFREMVRYSTKEIGTKEAKESFAELYRVVKEQSFGVDQVLDDIISTSDWPF